MTTPTAAPAAKAFSPGEKDFPLPTEPQSDRLRKALAEAGSNTEFRRGVDPLRTVGIHASFKTVERVSERVGEEVRASRHGPFALVEAAGEAPANPPELQVLQADGMRVRLTEDREDESSETASDGPGTAESGGWSECKVAVVSSAIRGRTDSDGVYHEPETLTQTNLATMEGVDLFGEMLLAEATRRGMDRAGEVVAVSDAGHGLPEMWARLFPGVFWVLDYFHVLGRLWECAREVMLPGARLAKLMDRWESWLYGGETTKLLRALRVQARRFVDRPEKPCDLPEKSPGRILWTHVFYIERYRDHMDYATYRRKGWPIGSGHAESLAKQVGLRMKAASKRWTPQGAEAMANLVAERASQDGRWEKRWPEPLPRPELAQPS